MKKIRGNEMISSSNHDQDESLLKVGHKINQKVKLPKQATSETSPKDFLLKRKVSASDENNELNVYDLNVLDIQTP